MSTETEVQFQSNQHHINEKIDKQSTGTSASNRYQLLKARKAELERKLNEKYNLLQQICREEAHLTGIYPSDFNFGSTNESNSSNTLRRKIGTSFKLPENLLNNNEDDVNKLLLEKQIQIQISEASLRLANDSSQTKSIRRTHKQNYEAAQQKLLSIDQNLTLMKNRQLHQQSAKKITQDDINLHKNANRLLIKNNLLAQAGNAQTLNCNSSLMYMERRNSMKSTTSSLGSSNTFIVQSPPNHPDSFTTPKMIQHQSIRTRHDSFSNNSHFEYESQHSPTPSHYSIQSSQQHHQQQLYLQHQQMLRYQKSLKIKADQNYSSNHYHHNHSQIYPNSNESPQQYAHRLHALNMQQAPQQMVGSPLQTHYAQDLLLTAANSPQNSPYRSEIHQSHSMRHTSYSDELKENNHQMIMQQQIRYHRTSNVEHVRQLPQIQPQRNIQQQGLGGYWALDENNEKVWCQTNDEKFSSLDRKSQIQKLKSTSSPNITAKANSNSNFDLSSKDDAFSPDIISISSGNSTENKKREKVWRETSLDGPIPTTPKSTKPLNRIKSSTSTTSLPPQPYSHHLQDSINNNHLNYPTSPTSTKSFPNPNHGNYRTVSPTLSLQHPSGIPVHLRNQLQLSARNSVYSMRDDESNIYDNVGPPQNPSFYNSNMENLEHQRTNQYPNLPPKAKLRHTESTKSMNSGPMQMYQGDYENNNMRQVSPTPTIMSTSTYISTQSPALNIIKSPDIQTESPKNVTIIQQGKIQPYKEVSKPFEMSDFYKYSTKFRQQTQSAAPK